MDNFKQFEAMKATEGKVFVSGEEITSSVNFSVNGDIATSEINILGSNVTGDKQGKVKITGTITQYKATPWLREYFKKVKSGEEVPPIQMQGVVEDKSSYYYKRNGVERIQVIDVILTGTIPLFALDAEGDIIQEEVNFTALDVR